MSEVHLKPIDTNNFIHCNKCHMIDYNNYSFMDWLLRTDLEDETKLRSVEVSW